jgi:RNA-directed DNA polymerase
MLTLANVIWGARCGKSARRVLPGETNSSGHAHSVRGARESAALRQAPHGLPPSRLVSTTLLDEWFEKVVKPRLKGEAHEMRFADDAILCFERKEDAEKVLGVLPKRFAKYGLTLHPEKTRLIEFGRFAAGNAKRRGEKPATFDFLGFTHIGARSRKGKFTVHVKTIAKRFRRGLKAVADWCREHRHDPVSTQQKTLNAKLRGHYQYYGRPTNYRSLVKFYRRVRRIWRKWLSRRTRGHWLTWERYAQILRQHPLMPPRIMHSWASGEDCLRNPLR